MIEYYIDGRLSDVSIDSQSPLSYVSGPLCLPSVSVVVTGPDSSGSPFSVPMTLRCMTGTTTHYVLGKDWLRMASINTSCMCFRSVSLVTLVTVSVHWRQADALSNGDTYNRDENAENFDIETLRDLSCDDLHHGHVPLEVVDETSCPMQVDLIGAASGSDNQIPVAVVSSRDLALQIIEDNLFRSKSTRSKTLAFHSEQSKV